jgi:hypothetical protein
MAAKTPTVIDLGSAGGVRRLLCQFADIDDTDVWTSGLLNVLTYAITNKTDGVAVSATISGTVFTFTVASSGSNKVVDMIVYTRS